MACTFANGAIIGSAFVKQMEGEGPSEEKVSAFIKTIR
jgi:tryptophan synthase alpha subunit